MQFYIHQVLDIYYQYRYLMLHILGQTKKDIE